MGSEDPLQNFSKRAYMFKRGQVEHVLTMANFELKLSLFMPRPVIHCTLLAVVNVFFLCFF